MIFKLDFFFSSGMVDFGARNHQCSLAGMFESCILFPVSSVTLC